VTAAVELGGGLVSLVAPSLMATLLPGAGLTSPESILVERVGRAALLSIGLSCWLERNRDPGAPAVGLIAGVLVYDAAAAVLVLYAALVERIGLTC
jgi:hypothetical protein